MLPLLVVVIAMAAPGEDERRHHQAPAFHVGDEENCPLNWKNLAALKLIGVASIPRGEVERSEAQYGFGVVYERGLIDGHFEIELSFNVISTPLGTHLPIDLLFKKPLHVSHIVEPYFGAGAVATIAPAPESFIAPGALASGGTYVWIRGNLGYVVEVDYVYVREPTEWRHEVEFSTGPLLRF